MGRQWGGSGEAVGRQWGGSGEAVGRQWGGSGEAVCSLITALSFGRKCSFLFNKEILIDLVNLIDFVNFKDADIRFRYYLYFRWLQMSFAMDVSISW